MSATTTAIHWKAIRGELEESAARFVELVRTVEGEARATGQWTVAETASHVSTVVEFDTFAAIGDPPRPELHELVEAAPTARPADVARLNSRALALDVERDLGVLATRVEAGVGHLLEATSGHDGTERISWLGELPLDVAAVLAHLTSELLVHGFDIARASKRPWEVPSSAAALTFEVFLVEVLRAMSGMAAEPVGDSRSFACEFRVRGTMPVVVVSDGSRLAVESPGRRVDARVGGDAAAVLLVMYRRINPLAALARGKLTVSGRRPWRLRHLSGMAP